MSYEIINKRKIICPCGKGGIELVIMENDFFQRKENLLINCQNCNSKYNIEKRIIKSKPYHEIENYFLIEKDNSINPECIKLEF